MDFSIHSLQPIAGGSSQDKRSEMIPGDHYLQTPEGACNDVADLLAAWLSEHDAIGP
jgi:hypothetical protein